MEWQARLARRMQGNDGTMTGILALAGAQGIINFSGGFPEPALLPTETIGEIAARLVADDPGVALQYTPSQGLASTREAMRAHVEATDGRRPGEDELMVTSGGIDAVTLVAQSLVDPGDLVLVEEPTYLGAVAGFVGLGASLGAVPTDADGLDVDALAGVLDAGADPKVLYVIPDHQNPTGRTLAPERRQPLVDLCRRHGVLVLEDVAYRELGFDGTAHPSLWSLAPDVVVQAGTFSKTFSPGVRLGWAAGPAAVVAAMVVAKQNTDQCSGALGQRLVEEYIRGGHFPAQVAREQSLYRRRGEAVEAALQRHMPDDVAWTTPKGGFFVWVHVPGVDTVELAAKGVELAVAFVPGAAFFAEREEHEYLRLSFSRVADDDIDEGIRRLAEAIALARGTSTGPGSQLGITRT